MFSNKGNYYKQIDGVSMGSPLGPTPSNTIMTEFEKIIIKPLINNGTIAFYTRHADDTIVLAKPCDLDRILKQFNPFHPQIQFTIDQFTDNDIHFLDIQILPMVPQFTANKLTLDNFNISPVIHHGQERLPGYVHLFIVPTKSVATMIFYKKKSTISNDLCHGMVTHGYLSPYSLLQPLLIIPIRKT